MSWKNENGKRERENALAVIHYTAGYYCKKLLHILIRRNLPTTGTAKDWVFFPLQEGCLSFRHMNFDKTVRFSLFTNITGSFTTLH
jgi:hypothetical protein